MTRGAPESAIGEHTQLVNIAHARASMSGVRELDMSIGRIK